MPDDAPHTSSVARDAAVRELLASGERTRLELPQQLRQRLGFADPSLFNDELIARSRGLLVQLTEQLAGGRLPSSYPMNSPDTREAILDAVFKEPRLLSYCHSLTLEYQVTNRLAQDADLDPLLPPLLQEMIASKDEAASDLAAACLAAQTRYLRNMERMQLPLSQLPAELLHLTLEIGRERLKNTLVPDAVEQAVRTSYDEGVTRHLLFRRLVTAPDFSNRRGWQLEKAGVPLFLAKLTMPGKSGYEGAALLLSKGQMVRLALTLRSLGCSSKALQRNLLLLHGEGALPVATSVSSGGAEEVLGALDEGFDGRTAA